MNFFFYLFLVRPAVGKGPGEQGEHPLGHHGRHGGHGEHGGRAGEIGQIPDQGVLRDRAAEDGQGLPRPEEDEFLLPMWDHLVLSFPSRGKG